MRHLCVARTLASMCVVVACATCEAAAQTADDLFAANAVQDVFISVNDRDLAELRERYQENVYFPADVAWRDLRLHNVGIRSRGLASRSAMQDEMIYQTFINKSDDFAEMRAARAEERPPKYTGS
jgi:spore coat protein CotH